MAGGIIRKAARDAASARVMATASATSPTNASAPRCTKGWSRPMLLPTTRTFSPLARSALAITEPTFPDAPKIVYIFVPLSRTLLFLPSCPWLVRDKSLKHRHLHARLLRELNRFRVARVHVAGHAHSRIIGQYSFDALGHFRGAIRAGHLTRVLRIANPHAAAIVDRNPGSAARRADQGVQQRPIRNRVGAVLHRFSLAVR